MYFVCLNFNFPWRTLKITDHGISNSYAAVLIYLRMFEQRVVSPFPRIHLKTSKSFVCFYYTSGTDFSTGIKCIFKSDFRTIWRNSLLNFLLFLSLSGLYLLYMSLTIITISLQDITKSFFFLRCHYVYFSTRNSHIK